ncbi:MAG TPA: hypothetical protein VGN17_17410 [Bryobacteraceae bacterium]|jgi:hypothetical protein
MPLRESLLKLLLLAGAACVAITEALSPFHLLTRPAIIVAWLIAFAALAYTTPRPSFHPRRPTLLEALYLTAIAAILVTVLYTALHSAPNSADAMAYHLPRIIYWIQARSIAFFPTPYLNQISLQPFAEYAMFHTYLLSGGDHFVNLIQFTGFAGSIVGASLLAAALGLDRPAQIVAALAAATLPNGILQASGAKNDCLLSLWLIALVYFTIRREPFYIALALGLALGTKATAYLFAPPMLVAAYFLAPAPRQIKWSTALAVLIGALWLNAPQFARNLDLSGSPLGFDSAQADGVYRWRNDNISLKGAASNILRNLSEQLGARSPSWNEAVYRASLRAHAFLGADPEDPATTWAYAKYLPPKNSAHEADANNRWHLLLIAVAALSTVIFPSQRRFWPYAAALLAAFLLFCAYLKWQPYLSRLELPLFLLAAPLIAALVRKPAWLQGMVCLFLLSGARLPALENWTRPLRGPQSILHQPRDLQYFNDLIQFPVRDQTLSAVDRFAALPCKVIGLDINQNQLEYPFQALLLEKDPHVRFIHVNVHNPSARYARPDDPQPCATFQLR